MKFNIFGLFALCGIFAVSSCASNKTTPPKNITPEKAKISDTKIPETFPAKFKGYFVFHTKRAHEEEKAAFEAYENALKEQNKQKKIEALRQEKLLKHAEAALSKPEEWPTHAGENPPN